MSLEAKGLDQLIIGFIGCGKISSALCRGFASHPDPKQRPSAILVSRRSEDKSRALHEEFPSIVQVLDDNSEIVRRSEVVFIGLLPGAAAEQLPGLPFRNTQLIISMMAAVNFERTLSLLPSKDLTLVRTVPLPSSARRTGPILQFPANAEAEWILRFIGTPVICRDEDEMKPMIAVTGHISSFYELMRVTQTFLEDNNVAEGAASQFVKAFYSSLASGAEQSAHSLSELRDEAATPGGLNEQSITSLTASPHFELQTNSLSAILNRLNGK